MQLDHKCEHAACKCVIDPDQRFCSDYCENEKNAGSGCGCGHNDCEMGAEIPLEFAAI